MMPLQIFPDGDGSLERETIARFGFAGDVLAVNGMNVEWSWDRRTKTTIKVHEGKELNWTEFRRHENKVVCKMLK